MNKQVKTTKIKGGVDYAKVVDRLGEFRASNPRSKISVKFSYDQAGNLTHTARLWKDKTDYYELLKSGVSAEDALESCEAEGSSFMTVERLKQEKGFEKNETIAIGRALAILGYAVSGEVASSEEMEEFEAWQHEKVEEVLKSIDETKSLDELLGVWKNLTKEQQLNKEIAAKKDAKKEELK